jgi:hypothetical protein
MKKQTFRFIARWAIAAFSLKIATLGWAQVTVQKNGLDVPEGKVKILYQATFRVVAHEFHLHNNSSPRVPIMLVLGDPNERVSGDEVAHAYVIYMESWNEAKFALAASRIALQHLVSEDRKQRMVSDILRSANRVAPVPFQALR